MYNICFCCCHHFLVTQLFFLKKNLCDWHHFWMEAAGGKQSPTGTLTHNAGEDSQRSKTTMGMLAGAKGRKIPLQKVLSHHGAINRKRG